MTPIGGIVHKFKNYDKLLIKTFKLRISVSWTTSTMSERGCTKRVD